MMRPIARSEKRNMGLPDILHRARRALAMRRDRTRAQTSNERLTGGGDEAQHEQ